MVVPPTVLEAIGLPTDCDLGNDALSTALNCSCQLLFVTSFHSIGVFARLLLLASNTVSVVAIDTILSCPDAAIFLFG